LYKLCCRTDEPLQVRALTSNHQAWVGAELAGTLGEGGDEALRQRFGA
jgi:hypothetical protein